MYRIENDIYVGKQFGCYLIVGKSEDKGTYGHSLYIGECVGCKTQFVRRIIEFKGAPKVCNHGLVYLGNGNFVNSRLRKIFEHMLYRCYREYDKSYKFYGARNITICDEWLENPSLFEQWAHANGYDDGLTIDRIDSNKGYCPENCRWISLELNSKWKSNTHIIEVDGIKDSGRGWSERLGLSVNYINRYIRANGMEQAIEFIKEKLS